MELLITDTNESFESWLGKDFLTEDLKATLSQASILIVPFENLREDVDFAFPTGTEDLLGYFRDNLPQDYTIDICISDDAYKEFAFNSDYKRIGNFVITAMAVPIFVSVMSAYIYNKYIKEDDAKPQVIVVDKSKHKTVTNHISQVSGKKYLEPVHVKFSVSVVDSNGTSKNISYEGPAKEADTVFKALKEYEGR